MVFMTVDKLVQEKVMGWEEFDPYFSPTTCIKDAMKVEEKLYELGFNVLFRRCTGMHCWLVNSGEAKEGDFFCNVSKDGESYSDRPTTYKSVAKTLPKAICYSALKAVGCDFAH
jgi:hypothetical protein